MVLLGYITSKLLIIKILRGAFIMSNFFKNVVKVGALFAVGLGVKKLSENREAVKQEIEKLAEKSTSKMDFLSRVKDQYNLSLSDAKIVADKFFKKEV